MSQEDVLDVDAQTDLDALQTPAIVEEAPLDAPPGQTIEIHGQAPLAEAPKSPLRQWAESLDARLVALEGAAHSGHHLDERAIEEIVARVMARIEEYLKF